MMGLDDQQSAAMKDAFVIKWQRGLLKQSPFLNWHESGND